jgi:hypothetical protein
MRTRASLRIKAPPTFPRESLSSTPWPSLSEPHRSGLRVRDPSDKLPGAAGVGLKRAAQLVARKGSSEEGPVAPGADISMRLRPADERSRAFWLGVAAGDRYDRQP